jgi:hypothetical protein
VIDDGLPRLKREERPVLGPDPDREERVLRLIRVGELEVSGEDEAQVDAYFAPN